MEFQLTTNTTHYKEWFDETEQYRITWQDQCYEVDIQACYHACVLTETGWGFAGRQGRYRTKNAAIKACEKNSRVWRKFIKITGRDKVTKVRTLKEKSFVGKGNTGHSIMWDVPVWVCESATERLLEILCTPSKRSRNNFE